VISLANVYDTLAERGFIYQVTDEAALRAALDRPLTLYCGYDPTSDSITAGNLLTTMALAHCQRAGHEVIGLIGGGTGLVGDPSGKTSARPLLTVEEVDANAASQREMIGRVIRVEDGRGLIVNNAAWLRSLHLLDFLRETGRHFSVNRMLDMEFARSRITAGDGLSFLEFSYVLLQAYDFLHLFREHGCTLQIGGSDQWANILAGVDLIRREEGVRAHGLVIPLLTTASGQKMGKSETGAIYLHAGRTSPYEFYQFWLNTEDADVERFLALYTFLPMSDVRSLGQLRGADLRVAKERLAWEVTALVHGTAAADTALATSRALFGDEDGAHEAAPTTEVPAAEVATGIPVLDLLVRAGLAGSKRRARTLIDQRGVRLNGESLLVAEYTLGAADFPDGVALLRKGRKTFHRVVMV
jgi:tyrosyl-tRNA synthetase